MDRLAQIQLAAASLPGGDGGFLVCRSGATHCALPVEAGMETLRPLPLESLAGMPDFLLGLSRLRGQVTPVVHLGRLLTGAQREAQAPARWVRLSSGQHGVALAVDAVLGLRQLDGAELADLPPLLQASHDRGIHQIGALDEGLLLVLQGARLLPESFWDRLDPCRSPS